MGFRVHWVKVCRLRVRGDEGLCRKVDDVGKTPKKISCRSGTKRGKPLPYAALPPLPLFTNVVSNPLAKFSHHGRIIGGIVTSNPSNLIESVSSLIQSLDNRIKVPCVKLRAVHIFY